VKLGYIDQSRDSLNDKTQSGRKSPAASTSWKSASIETQPSRAYVGAFNFKGGDQQKKVGQLSGGERNRVHLAKMLKEGSNLLLLDEPTNDLDVETLQALEAALEDFPAAPSSSATIAGSWTASPRTSSPSKATAMSNGSKATSRTMRKTRSADWARTPPSRNARRSRSSRDSSCECFTRAF
jgi:ABC-type glutathione transport system ATPase component